MSRLIIEKPILLRINAGKWWIRIAMRDIFPEFKFKNYLGLQGLLCVKYSGFHRRNGVEKRVRVAGHHVGTQGVSFCLAHGCLPLLAGPPQP